MATYDTLVATVFGKFPLFLYEFERGGVTTRLVGGPQDYTDTDAVTWTKSSITHSRPKITSALERAETFLTFPQSDAFARTYLGDLTYEDNKVTVYREFKDQTPPARVVKYQGRVVSAKPMFTRLTLTMENRFTELRRKGVSLVMQRSCPHALYHSRGDFGCRLNINRWLHGVEVSAISGNEITIDSTTNSTETAENNTGNQIITAGADWFNGGVFKWDGKQQMIVRQEANVFRLLGPVPGLADAITAASPGTLSAQAAPGCDRTRNHCAFRFQNLNNFGGFPEMDESYSDGRQLV